MHYHKIHKILTIAVFIGVTLPLMYHTAQLLVLMIAPASGPSFIQQAYAALFAIGFDLGVFMFSLFGMRSAQKAFSILAGIVAFFFFNLDILTYQLPQATGPTGLLWSKVLLGCMFAMVGAFLVYHSTELIKKVFEEDLQAAEPVAKPKGPKKRRYSNLGPGLPPYEEKPTPPQPPENGKYEAPPKEKGELISRAKRLKEKGLTLIEIGEQLGKSKSTISNYLNN